jgi:SET domain-containing protein
MYLFDLSNDDLKSVEGYCVDAAKRGNVSRFLNHSCDPNAGPVWLFAETHDARFPTIAIFATKNISCGQEV